jgi:hypothetical protein
MLDNPLPDPDDLDFDADAAAADVPAENWPSDFGEASPDDRELTDFPTRLMTMRTLGASARRGVIGSRRHQQARTHLAAHEAIHAHGTAP